MILKAAPVDKVQVQLKRVEGVEAEAEMVRIDLQKALFWAGIYSFLGWENDISNSRMAVESSRENEDLVMK